MQRLLRWWCSWEESVLRLIGIIGKKQMGRNETKWDVSTVLALFSHLLYMPDLDACAFLGGDNVTYYWTTEQKDTYA